MGKEGLVIVNIYLNLRNKKLYAKDNKFMAKYYTNDIFVMDFKRYPIYIVLHTLQNRHAHCTTY